MDHKQRHSPGGILYSGPEESPNRFLQAMDKKYRDQGLMSNELTTQMNDRANQRNIYRSAKITSEQINVEKAKAQMERQKTQLFNEHK